MVRGRGRLAILAVAVALVATSCTDDGGIDAPSAAEAARAGGLITVGINPPSSLEPSNAADPSSALVVRTMCDPLVQTDPVSGAIKPAMAESWIISDDGRRFTIKLRKGMRFHDGSEVTSDDAVFSLARVASEQAASPLALLLRDVKGFAKVHGDEKASERAARALEGARAVSKYGFEITLDNPNADFIRVLAHPLSSIVPKRVVERDPVGFASRPVCAGPYRLAAAWSPNSGATAIRLERFGRYRPVNEAYTGAGRGYADEIEFRILPDPAAELDRYQAGDLDVAHVPRSRVAQARLAGADLVQAPAPTFEYIGLPNRRAPFDNAAVRVALSRALDRRALVRRVFDDAALPAQGFVPPTLGAAHRDAACGTGAPDGGDVEGARATLAASGVDLAAAGEVALYFNDEFGHRALVDDVARQWQTALGMRVRPVPMPWERYLAQAASVGGFDAPFRLSWSSQVPSPDAYLAPLFDSNNAGRDNLSFFSDPDFDRMLERVARRSEKERDRRLDYQQLEDMVCESMPVVPIDFGVTLHLVRQSKLASARGPLTDLSTGNVLLRELYVK